MMVAEDTVDCVAVAVDVAVALAVELAVEEQVPPF